MESGARWFKRRAVLALVVLVATLAILAVVLASGGSSPSPSRSGRCAILANGQKLCGDDLAAYCQTFEQGNSLDFDTFEACASVGVNLPTDPTSGTP